MYCPKSRTLSRTLPYTHRCTATHYDVYLCALLHTNIPSHSAVTDYHTASLYCAYYRLDCHTLLSALSHNTSGNDNTALLHTVTPYRMYYQQDVHYRAHCHIMSRTLPHTVTHLHVAVAYCRPLLRRYRPLPYCYRTAAALLPQMFQFYIQQRASSLLYILYDNTHNCNPLR